MKSSRRLGMLGLMVVGSVASSCVTPPAPSVPPPTLPAEVGVQWWRDTGGTYDANSGYYTPTYDQYSLLDGTVTGPEPAGPSLASFPVSYFASSIRPDGTALYPWNGFAGEGIATVPSSPSEGVRLSFPGGECTVGYGFFDGRIGGIHPSPDGTMIAVRNYDLDGSSIISIKTLVDGGACPTMATASYTNWAGSNDGDAPRDPLVWAPDSSAIVYQVDHESNGGWVHSVEGLNATGGAAASNVLPAGDDVVSPVGWSIANRILLVVSSDTPATAALASVPVTGGSLRTLSQSTVPPTPTSGGGLAPLVGFFVPGTTSIVFNKATMVTNTDGLTVPWIQVHVIADATGAVPGPILGSPPPLAWHEAALNDGTSSPPFNTTQVPNGELVDRFVH